MVEEREEGNQEKGQLRMLGFGICCFSDLWLHVNATRPGDHRENKQEMKNKKGKDGIIVSSQNGNGDYVNPYL